METRQQKKMARERESERRAELAYELDDLALKLNVKLSDKTFEHINYNYWGMLTKLLRKGNHLSLPASYELDNVNWLYTFFDYLATDPAQDGGPAFENEYTIPDTIIIKQRRAYAWLTANKGPIVRKDKISELQPQFILEGLCASYAKHCKGGVIHAHTVLAHLVVTRAATLDNPRPTQTIEYFNKAMLQKYLYERLRTDDRTGILQLFIAPPGNRNAMMRAWWTPHSLCIEQRANKNNLWGGHTSLSSRSSTFDGNMNDSEIRNLHGEELRNEVAEQLEWMLDHLSDLLPYTHAIWSATFYFKMGNNGRLYLLWCSDVQFEQRSTGIGNTSSCVQRHRPSTPRCLPSGHAPEAGEEDSSADKVTRDAMSLGPFGNLHSKKEICPSCGLSDGDAGCEAVVYPARYMAVIRQLSSTLYNAIVAEELLAQAASRCKADCKAAALGKECDACAQVWAEYLERANAVASTNCGEDMDKKFARPVFKAVDAKGKFGDKRGRSLEADEQFYDRTRMSEVEAETDRGYMRQVVQALCTGPRIGSRRSIGIKKLRELVLYSACNPSFAQRLVKVCQACCLEINQTEMFQFKRDVDTCAAPLDVPLDKVSNSQPCPKSRGSRLGLGRTGSTGTASSQKSHFARDDLGQTDWRLSESAEQYQHDRGTPASSNGIRSTSPVSVSPGMHVCETQLVTQLKKRSDLENVHRESRLLQAVQTAAFSERSKLVLQPRPDSREGLISPVDDSAVRSALADLERTLTPNWKVRMEEDQMKKQMEEARLEMQRKQSRRGLHRRFSRAPSCVSISSVQAAGTRASPSLNPSSESHEKANLSGKVPSGIRTPALSVEAPSLLKSKFSPALSTAFQSYVSSIKENGPSGIESDPISCHSTSGSLSTVANGAETKPMETVDVRDVVPLRSRSVLDMSDIRPARSRSLHDQNSLSRSWSDGDSKSPRHTVRRSSSLPSFVEKLNPMQMAASPVCPEARPANGEDSSLPRRKASELWQSHFNAARHLTELTQARMLSEDIREEVGEAHTNLAALAIEIERERRDQRQVRAILRTVAANKGATFGKAQNPRNRLPPLDAGAATAEVRAVTEVSMSQIRKAIKQKVVNKFMSPRLRSRALELYEVEKEACKEEEQERRARLAELLWSHLGRSVQHLLLNKSTVRLRRTAARYARGETFTSSGEEEDNINDKRQRQERRKAREGRPKSRMHFVPWPLGEAAGAEVKNHSDASVLVTHDDMKPEFAPSRPPVGAVGGGGRMSGGREEGQVLQVTAVSSSGGGSMYNRRESVSEGGEGRKVQGKVCWKGLDEQTLDDDDGSSERKAGATKEVEKVVVARKSGFGGQDKELKDHRIKGGKAAPFVEKEREAWKLRVKEREAEREAARARRRERASASPALPARGVAYIKSAEDVKKKYHLVDSPHRKLGGGGLLLPGGGMVFPLTFSPSSKPRSNSSPGIMKPQTEQACQPLDPLGNKEAPSTDVIQHEDLASQSVGEALKKVAVVNDGPMGAERAFASEKRVKRLAKSAYYTPFVQALMGRDKTGRVIFRRKPHMLRASLSPLMPEALSKWGDKDKHIHQSEEGQQLGARREESEEKCADTPESAGEVGEAIEVREEVPKEQDGVVDSAPDITEEVGCVNGS